MKREETPAVNEEKIGHAMVKGRLITEIQLKTALDYQRSLGGALTEVVTKLGFVRPPVLTKFLAQANLLGGASPRDTGPPLMKKAFHSPGSAVKKAPKASREEPSSGGQDESEAPTQHPAARGEPPAGSALLDCDPVVRALLAALVQKGVFTSKEEERILQAGSRAAAR
jgi:hypothetical protein